MIFSASAHLTDSDKIRGLKWIILCNLSGAVFVTLTLFGPVFSLYMNELGLNTAQIGLLLSVLPFCGLLAPLVAPYAARVGYKLTFFLTYLLRYLFICGLLVLPWVAERMGLETAFALVLVSVLGFSIFRAVSDSAWFAWVHEAVPAKVRGRFGAISNSFSTLVGIASMLLASWYMTDGQLDRYVVLFAVGIGAGVISAMASLGIPGGGRELAAPGGGVRFAQLRSAVGDTQFMLFLAGLSLTMFAWSPVGAFIPLLLREVIKLPTSSVLLIQVGVLVGNLAISYLWGWAADRFGSKPVLMVALGLLCLVPLAWLLVPMNAPSSLAVALVISVLTGLATMAYIIGYMQHLFVAVVPPENKANYMGIFYAAIGLAGGLGPLLAGGVVDLFRSWAQLNHWSTFNPYLPVFVGSFLLLVIGTVLLGRLEGRGSIPVGKFAAMFFRGNPLMAVTAVMRYSLAGEERERISQVEKLSSARNPLGSGELLDALSDPSFNVRLEAINSIGRAVNEPALTDALINIVDDGELDLRSSAISALGRIGDQQALPTLRSTLGSPFPLLRSRSARALGRLGDTASADRLMDLVHSEKRFEIRVAYGSALGAMHHAPAVGAILKLLLEAHRPIIRAELALAIARIVGHEKRFVKLHKQMQADPALGASLTLQGCRKLLRRFVDRPSLQARLQKSVSAFARGELHEGADTLRKLLKAIPREYFGQAGDSLIAKLILLPDEQALADPVVIELMIHLLQGLQHNR